MIGGQQTFASPYPLPPGIGYLRFLSQSAIQKILQAGVHTKAYIHLPVGEVRVDFGYTLEYLFSAINNYVDLRLEYRY